MTSTSVRILAQLDLMFGDVVHPLVEERNIIDSAQGAEEKREHIAVYRIGTLQILLEVLVCKTRLLLVHSSDDSPLHLPRWLCILILHNHHSR